MAASADHDTALRSLYPHSRLFDAMGREVWIQESRTTENDGPDYESGPPSLFQAPKKKPNSKGKGAKKDAKQVERKPARRGKPSAKAKEALAIAEPASGGEHDQGTSSSSTSILEPGQVQRRSKRKRNAEPADSDISFTSAQPTDPSPARVNCILDELRISKRSKPARHASPPGSALPPRSPTASRGDHHPQTDWLGERRDYVTTPFSTPPTPVRDSIVGHGLQSSAATRQSFESGAMRHLPSDSIEYGFEACDNSEDSGDDAETIIGISHTWGLARQTFRRPCPPSPRSLRPPPPILVQPRFIFSQNEARWV